MRTVAVIGKNFGDEGKGLASAALSCYAQKQGHDRVLIVKHNGGAQAGHTVESADGSYRFIHHQIGSGAEYGAATLWAATYTPDLYQIGKEVATFQKAMRREWKAGTAAAHACTMTGDEADAGEQDTKVRCAGALSPVMYAESSTSITIIDDVLLNMALESMRGENRHGSCGMGINACCERHQAGYRITVEDVKQHDVDWLVRRLTDIRERYTLPRALDLGIPGANDYWDLLQDENVLLGFAHEVKANAELVKVVDANRDWLQTFDVVVFESGQGLLLDEDYLEYAPHLTSSRTGLHNPATFLVKRGLTLNEVIYVTRPYVTRHGAGPLPGYDPSWEAAMGLVDRTNEPNDWQGTIRYAKHVNLASFTAPVKKDLESALLLWVPARKDDERLVAPTLSNVERVGELTLQKSHSVSLLVTHLDETKDVMHFQDGDVSIEAFAEALGASGEHFDRLYVSRNHAGFEILKSFGV